MTERYRLRIARSAARALAELLPEKVAAAAYALITGPLLDDPHGVGKPLQPPMAPSTLTNSAWTARRGTYRILYLLDETQRIIDRLSNLMRTPPPRTRSSGACCGPEQGVVITVEDADVDTRNGRATLIRLAAAYRVEIGWANLPAPHQVRPSTAMPSQAACSPDCSHSVQA